MGGLCVTSQKKEYVKPQMLVQVFSCQSQLLCTSGDCGGNSYWGDSGNSYGEDNQPSAGDWWGH